MKTKHLAILHSVIVAAMTLQAPIVRAETSSPSQLLEKGIYTEETKGDLEGAIAIYQELVAAAKANQTLAAQAQLRLGQCLLKKNRRPEAMEAFQKLIRDFPNEKEVVAKAREYLPGELVLDPVPWVDGERLQMVIKLPGGLDVGAMELRSDLVEVNGQKAWRVGRRMSGGAHMLSVVDVDLERFRPLTSYWRHTLLGTVSAEFKAGEVVMRREGAEEPTTVRVDKAVFDNEQVMHLMRRLPLQDGYKTSLSVITTLGGGAVLPIGIEVIKKEAVQAPAGTFECYKVTLDVGQTFWYSADEHRYLVKFDAGGAEAYLTSISQRKAGAPVVFRDETLGVSFTAPADWVIHRTLKTEAKDKAIIYLLDPAARAEQVTLYLKSNTLIPAAARQSVRALADYDLRENLDKSLKDAKVRPASWKSYNVSGRPAVSCVVDYTERDTARIALLVYSVGPTNCENFVLSCKPEDLEGLQKDFDQIIASYRATK